MISLRANKLTLFAQGNDIFINLPMGFGKSLIFQASTVIVDFLKVVVGGNDNHDNDDIGADEKSLVVVVLPLKALAVDQLDHGGMYSAMVRPSKQTRSGGC